jgi:hypothetical protein
MSIPRKRGNVKKKISAAKKVVKKKKVLRKPPAAKKKRPAQAPKPTKKKAKRPLSVNTRRPVKRKKVVSKPHSRPAKQPIQRKKKKSAKKRPAIRRTPPKSVSGRSPALEAALKDPAFIASLEKQLEGVTLEDALKDRVIIEKQFIKSPAVTEQIRDLLDQKGLAELTRGMVQTPESVILGHLIIAEALGNRDRRSYELAAEFGMSVQDIYSLWLSPPTKDL